MLDAPRFLIVDFHPESRYLLVRTLRRKYPCAQIDEIDEAEAALARIQAGGLSAVITHRTFDEAGVDLVRRFRAAAPKLPIVMVSGIDRAEAARAAGADRFLHYDEWLRIGSVVEELVDKPTTADPSDPDLVA